MDLFKGKSPAERNKLIAAILLGTLAVLALAFAFGPGIFSRGTATNVSVTTSPKPVATQSVAPGQFKMPTRDDQNFEYATTAIDYRPGSYGAAEPGRNIFAFHEPPPCYPNCPTPYVAPKTPSPTPVPTPYPFLITGLGPTTVFAGQKGFRLDVIGEGFTADTKIYFNQALMPTNFISPQRITTDIPANLIAVEGQKQVIVQSIKDPSKFSEQRLFLIQPPPKPQYEYVGMIARKFANNDTAYFIEKSKMNLPNVVPTGKRLNDVLAGRFRLISISEKETVFEDVNLGFKHVLPFNRDAKTASTSSPSGGFPSGFPTTGFPNGGRPGNVPGFPNVTVPRPARPTNANRPDRKTDEDDDDDDPNN
ncbi:MAG: hypothetical protein DMF62_09060 [Acidobacteria bacterium]|nr:MAG: hypothetical protein DMF62_09060 [Acidobacteriota bacterium]